MRRTSKFFVSKPQSFSFFYRRNYLSAFVCEFYNICMSTTWVHYKKLQDRIRPPRCIVEDGCESTGVLEMKPGSSARAAEYNIKLSFQLPNTILLLSSTTNSSMNGMFNSLRYTKYSAKYILICNYEYKSKILKNQ